MDVPPAQYPLALHLKHSALPSVLGRVLFFSFYAFVVCLVIEAKLVSGSQLSHVGTALMGILSMVTGIMVGLRSQSSTTRWTEARQIWCSVTSTTRILLRTLSLSIPINDSIDPTARTHIDDTLGLVVAFPIALSHHLKGEKGIAHRDLDALLPREYTQSLRRTASSVSFATHPIITQIPSFDSSSSLMEMLPLPPGQRGKGDDSPERSQAEFEDGEDEAEDVSEEEGVEDPLGKAGGIGSDASEYGKQDPALLVRGEMVSLGLEEVAGGTDEVSKQHAMLNVHHKGSPPIQSIDLSLSPTGSFDSSYSISDTSPTSAPRPLPSTTANDAPPFALPSALSNSNNPRPTHKTPRFQSHLFPPPSQQDRRDTSASIDSSAGTKPRTALASPAPANLPLSILRLLHAYLEGLAGSHEVLKEGTKERCLSLLAELTNSLGKAEMVRDTPIPLSLSVHLHQMISLYLLAIPLALASTVGKLIIPVIALATFCYLGVDSIGEHLSDPFGNHATALPLSRFTASILQESLTASTAFSASYVSRLARLRKPLHSFESFSFTPGKPKPEDESRVKRLEAEEAAEEARLNGEWEGRGDRWLPCF